MRTREEPFRETVSVLGTGSKHQHRDWNAYNEWEKRSLTREATEAKRARARAVQEYGRSHAEQGKVSSPTQLQFKGKSEIIRNAPQTSATGWIFQCLPGLTPGRRRHDGPQVRGGGAEAWDCQQLESRAPAESLALRAAEPAQGDPQPARRRGAE